MTKRSEAWWCRELVTEDEDLLGAFSAMHSHVGSTVVPEGKGGSLLDRRENPPLQAALERYAVKHRLVLSDMRRGTGV